jgi:L-seryl-tRNA(Ser) seleniumtransferase
VTISGDKLLGGPQAGFIIGRRELLERINRNPMKRALRVDKIRLAAIEANLKLYRDPDRLAERLPTLGALARPRDEIEALSQRMLPVLAASLGERFRIAVTPCASQIGSGALPRETIPSAGLSIWPKQARGTGRLLLTLAARLRALPIPVIGRIQDQSLVLDLRCLTDEAGFLRNISGIDLSGAANAVA